MGRRCSPKPPWIVGKSVGPLSQVLFAEIHEYANLDGTRELRGLPSPWASPEKQDTDHSILGPPLKYGVSATLRIQLPGPLQLCSFVPSSFLQSRQVDKAASSPSLLFLAHTQSKLCPNSTSCHSDVCPRFQRAKYHFLVLEILICSSSKARSATD